MPPILYHFLVYLNSQESHDNVNTSHQNFDNSVKIAVENL